MDPPKPVELHVPLEALWAYRSAKVPLSNKEMQHLIQCHECLGILGLCQMSNTFAELLARINERRAA